MASLKVTDDLLAVAMERIAAGETRTDVASSLGISGRGLRFRLSKAGAPLGRPGRPKGQPLNHCRTCRCVAPAPRPSAGGAAVEG